MGSWDETCALSNLPICPGDKVVGIILRESPYSSVGEVCYISDNLLPSSFLFRGVYDDYGSLTDINKDKILELLVNQKVYTQEKDAENNSIFVEKQYSDIFDFLEAVYGEGVYVEVTYLEFKNDTYEKKVKYTPLMMMFMHAELFDVLIESISSRKVYNKQTNWKEENTQRVVKGWDKFLKVYKKMPNFCTVNFSNYVRLSNNLGFNITDFIASYIVNEEEFSNLFLQKVVELTTFELVLSLLRSGYLTYTGRGSQNQERYLHKIKAEWVLKHYNDKMNEYQEDNIDVVDDTAMQETLYLFD